MDRRGFFLTTCRAALVPMNKTLRADWVFRMMFRVWRAECGFKFLRFGFLEFFDGRFE